MKLENIKGYDKISKYLKESPFIDYTFLKKINIVTFINYDGTIQKDISIHMVNELEDLNGLRIMFYDVKKFIYPNGDDLQVLGLDIEEISSWGWEKSHYRAYNFENDNDFEIICNDLEFDCF